MQIRMVRPVRRPGARAAIAIGLFIMVGCAPVAAVSVTTRASEQPAFEARLRALSVDPVIQRAAQHRLSIASREPEALAIAVAAPNETSRSVRSVLAEDVDDQVIVDWLVSFGAMGAWTAYNPRNAESVLIPVSDLPALVKGASGGPVIYRLRDEKHLMLVQPVVVGDTVVGAVGFVFAQTFDGTLLRTEAVQLS